MTMRSREKWRPIGLEGVSGRALDPQRIGKTIFGLVSQMVKTRIQSIVG